MAKKKNLNAEKADETTFTVTDADGNTTGPISMDDLQKSAESSIMTDHNGMTIEIKKAKLTNENHLILSYEKYDSKGYIVKVENEEHNQEADPDLVKKFISLDRFLADICELPEAENIDWENENAVLLNVGVRSFTRGGSGDACGIVLSGYRKLGSGQLLNLNSPFMKWEDPAYHYPGISMLSEAIHDIEKEIVLYLNGKRVVRQLEMEFPEEEKVENF